MVNEKSKNLIDATGLDAGSIPVRLEACGGDPAPRQEWEKSQEPTQLLKRRGRPLKEDKAKATQKSTQPKKMEKPGSAGKTAKTEKSPKSSSLLDC